MTGYDIYPGLDREEIWMTGSDVYPGQGGDMDGWF